jgi:hypothetical protein
VKVKQENLLPAEPYPQNSTANAPTIIFTFNTYQGVLTVVMKN